MTATGAQQIAFMKQAGMAVTTECRVTYTEVSPTGGLAYKTLTDFVPDVTPYEVATVVDLRSTADGVKATIYFDAMHDDIWNERARAGHESQLRKLDAAMDAVMQAVGIFPSAPQLIAAPLFALALSGGLHRRRRLYDCSIGARPADAPCVYTDRDWLPRRHGRGYCL
jgi:hypothetical protein